MSTETEIEVLDAVTQEALARLRAGQGLRGIVAAAAEALGQPVLLVSRRRRLAASAGLREGEDPLLALRSAAVTAPVEVRGLRWGGLSLVGEEAPPSAVGVLERIALLVELELLHSSEPVEAERRVAHELLVDLLAGRRGAGIEVRAAQLLGARANGAQFALAAVLEDGLLAEIERAAARVGAAVIATALDEELIALCGAPESSQVTWVARQLAEAVVVSRRTVDAAGPPLIALCGPIESLLEAGRRLREAREALAVARSLRLPETIVMAPQLLVDRLLARMLTEPDLASAFEDRLTPLRMLPTHTAQTLTDTLRVYLDCGGSKTVAAAQLGVRRQTLYGRLQRIEELVGPIEEPQNRLVLHLAVRAARQLEVPGGGLF